MARAHRAPTARGLPLSANAASQSHHRNKQTQLEHIFSRTLSKPSQKPLKTLSQTTQYPLTIIASPSLRLRIRRRPACPARCARLKCRPRGVCLALGLSFHRLIDSASFLIIRPHICRRPACPARCARLKCRPRGIYSAFCLVNSCSIDSRTPPARAARPAPKAKSADRYAANPYSSPPAALTPSAPIRRGRPSEELTERVRNIAGEIIGGLPSRGRKVLRLPQPSRRVSCMSVRRPRSYGASVWRPRAFHAASRFKAAALFCLWSRLSTHGRCRRVSRMASAFDASATGARFICFGCCFGALLGCGRRSSLRAGFSPSAGTLTPFCAARPRPYAVTLDPTTLSLIGGGSPLHACRTSLSLCALRCAPRTRRKPPCG